MLEWQLEIRQEPAAMSDENNRVTSFSSITITVLRELRLERNIHQAQVADLFGQTPSAWAKIETGKSPLSLEALFKVCYGLQKTSSSVLAATERYATLFSQRRWGVVSTLLEVNEDSLLMETQRYYGSPGFKARQPSLGLWGPNSVLDGPSWNADGTLSLADVFRFALDPFFRGQQLQETQLKKPSF